MCGEFRNKLNIKIREREFTFEKLPKIRKNGKLVTKAPTDAQERSNIQRFEYCFGEAHESQSISEKNQIQ